MQLVTGEGGVAVYFALLSSPFPSSSVHQSATRCWRRRSVVRLESYARHTAATSLDHRQLKWGLWLICPLGRPSPRWGRPPLPVRVWALDIRSSSSWAQAFVVVASESQTRRSSPISPRTSSCTRASSTSASSTFLSYAGLSCPLFGAPARDAVHPNWQYIPGSGSRLRQVASAPVSSLVSDPLYIGGPNRRRWGDWLSDQPVRAPISYFQCYSEVRPSSAHPRPSVGAAFARVQPRGSVTGSGTK